MPDALGVALWLLFSRESNQKKEENTKMLPVLINCSVTSATPHTYNAPYNNNSLWTWLNLQVKQKWKIMT